MNAANAPLSPPPPLSHALQQAQHLGLPRLEAQMLLLHCMGRCHHDRAWLLAHDQDTLPAAAAQHFTALCLRRLDGLPLAYLIGQREFHGLNLHVDGRVLDPRPDTETLVDWALEQLTGQPQPRVLDLGTGSGAIALAVQHQRPDAQVWAVDASAAALAVAQANAQRLGLPVHFRLGHWLQGWPAPDTSCGRFHLIVSNPPYIRQDDPHLSALRHEPQQALVSGADGLDDIRQIVVQARPHLHPGGWLLLEHGWDQGAAVAALLQQAGYAHVQQRHDLAGHLRCTGAQESR